MCARIHDYISAVIKEIILTLYFLITWTDNGMIDWLNCFGLATIQRYYWLQATEMLKMLPFREVYIYMLLHALLGPKIWPPEQKRCTSDFGFSMAKNVNFLHHAFLPLVHCNLYGSIRTLSQFIFCNFQQVYHKLLDITLLNGSI